MTTKYALLNPNTGGYTYYETKEQVLTQVATAAILFYLKYTHNSPYSIITINEDGSETWRNPFGVEQPNSTEHALTEAAIQELQDIFPD